MNRESRAVSPVIAVILMVAVTVVLSAAIGAFVFDLGQSTTSVKQQSLGVSTSQTDAGVEITVVTGEADKLRVLVDGEPSETILNPSPGDTARVSASAGQDVSVVSTRNGESSVVSSTTITTSSSLQNGLIARYQFEAGDGDIAYDTAGVYDGNISGASWTSANGKTMLSFDGTDDYVGTGPVVGAWDGITVTGWVKPTSVSNDLRILTRWSDAVQVYQRNDGVQFELNDSSTWHKVNTSSNTLAAGKWTFLAAVYDAPYWKIYVNDTLDVNSNIGTFTINSETKGTMGGTPQWSSRWFSGEMDEVRIYNRPLSSQEVSELYNTTR